MRILITYILINCEWFIIKLCGIGIILLTDLQCGITSYYFSIDLRFDCIFKHFKLFLGSWAAIPLSYLLRSAHVSFPIDIFIYMYGVNYAACLLNIYETWYACSTRSFIDFNKSYQEARTLVSSTNYFWGRSLNIDGRPGIWLTYTFRVDLFSAMSSIKFRFFSQSVKKIGSTCLWVTHL